MCHFRQTILHVLKALYRLGRIRRSHISHIRALCSDSVVIAGLQHGQRVATMKKSDPGPMTTFYSGFDVYVTSLRFALSLFAFLKDDIENTCAISVQSRPAGT